MSVEGLNLIPSPDDVAFPQDFHDIGIFTNADFPDFSATGLVDQSIEHSLDYQRGMLRFAQWSLHSTSLQM